MTAETDLLPCPFCGAAPFIGPLDPEDEGDGWTEISCANDDCPVAVTVEECGPTDDSPHRANAIAAWNRRACVSSATEALRAEVAELNHARRLAFEAGRAQASRAERLAEALRDLHDKVITAWPSLSHLPSLEKARAALDQETTNG